MSFSTPSAEFSMTERDAAYALLLLRCDSTVTNNHPEGNDSQLGVQAEMEDSATPAMRGLSMSLTRVTAAVTSTAVVSTPKHPSNSGVSAQQDPNFTNGSYSNCSIRSSSSPSTPNFRNSDQPKRKPLNLYKRHLSEQRRWAKQRKANKSYYEKSVTDKNLDIGNIQFLGIEKMQSRIGNPNKKGKSSPRRSLSTLFVSENVRILANKTKLTGNIAKANDDNKNDVNVNGNNANDDKINDARELLTNQDANSTNDNESAILEPGQTRIKYSRRAKTISTSMLTSDVEDSDGDSEFKIDEEMKDLSETEASDEEAKFSDENISNNNVLRKNKDNTPQMSKPSEISVPMSVPEKLLDEIKWNSYTQATRKLLGVFFTRSILATHSLTGKPSPAFPDKPAKKMLNPDVVEYIVALVSKRSHVPQNIVRTCITTKCADESKMLRQRKKKRRHLKENNPPHDSSSEE